MSVRLYYATTPTNFNDKQLALLELCGACRDIRLNHVNDRCVYGPHKFQGTETIVDWGIKSLFIHQKNYSVAERLYDTLELLKRLEPYR